MKTFIGTKIIQAMPKSKHEFADDRDREKNGNPEGYEQTLDEPGYMVCYSDGYISWSPKEVFEQAYREISEEEKSLL